MGACAEHNKIKLIISEFWGFEKIYCALHK